MTRRGTLLRTLVGLWPYIWPSDRADLKMRVAWATVLLLIAKLATIAVPFTFKWATDALAGHGQLLHRRHGDGQHPLGLVLRRDQEVRKAARQAEQRDTERAQSRDRDTGRDEILGDDARCCLFGVAFLFVIAFD